MDNLKERVGQFHRVSNTGLWTVLTWKYGRVVGIYHVQDDYGNLVPMRG